MSRLDDIVELIQNRESLKSRQFMKELIGWMGERDDEEVVELLRGACTELAWRATGGHAQPAQVYPSKEVFYEATERIAKTFYESVKERNVDKST